MLLKFQRYGLYLFLFSLNFEIWDPMQTDGMFSVAKLTGIIYFLLFIPSLFNLNTPQGLKPILRSIWIFFILLVLINALHTDSLAEYFIDFTYLQNILLFWIMLNHGAREPMALEKGMLYFAFGSVAAALLFYMGIGVEEGLGGRLTIFGENENIVGQRQCISIIILLLAVIQNRNEFRKGRLLLLLPIPIMVSLMMQTGSRLAVLSFVLAFMAGVFLFKTRKTSWKFLILVGGVAVFYLMWVYIMQSEVLRNRLMASFVEGNLSNRDVIWKNLLPLIKANPLFGVGQSGYARFCREIYGTYTSPHNVILELLVFTGGVGLTIYLIFMYQVFRKGLIAYRHDGLLLPMILMVIIGSILVVSHILEVKMGWALYAYCATSYMRNLGQPDEEEENEADEAIETRSGNPDLT